MSRRRRAASVGSSTDRLGVAGNARGAVGIASLRVVLPCPDMQLVERRQTVAIWGGDVIQQIPVQRRHPPAWIVTCPDARKHDELDANEAHGTVCHRLVNQSFRLLRVQYAC